MGCDIHLYCEYRITVNNKKKWICADHFMVNPYFGAYDDDEDESKYNVVHIYDGRNYELFGVLAGVRSNLNDQIDDPRDLPDDVTEEIKRESDRWGVDGHSHSWLTARELFDYQRTHKFTHECGMVSPEQVKRLDNGDFPTEWCGWTSSNNYVFREWDRPGCVLDYLIDVVKKRMSEVFWIWDFYDEDKKNELFDKFADDFRIVFWFDN